MDEGYNYILAFDLDILEKSYIDEAKFDDMIEIPANEFAGYTRKTQENDEDAAF